MDLWDRCRLSACVLPLLAGLGVLASSVATAVELNDAVFQEHLVAGNQYGPGYLFQRVGADDHQPELLVGSNAVADAAAEGWARTVGGALPRAEGALTFTQLDTTSRVLFTSLYGRTYCEWAVEQTGGDPYGGPVPVAVRIAGAVDSTLSEFASLSNLWVRAKIDGRGMGGATHAALGGKMGRCTLGPIALDEGFIAQAQVDERYTVALTALASGNVGARDATFSISAWVDPRIEIDPAFARREDFRLVFSSRVTPVPEAAMMSMLLLGLVLTAGAVRRGRRAGVRSVARCGLAVS